MSSTSREGAKTGALSSKEDKDEEGEDEGEDEEDEEQETGRGGHASDSSCPGQRACTQKQEGKLKVLAQSGVRDPTRREATPPEGVEEEEQRRWRSSAAAAAATMTPASTN